MPGLPCAQFYDDRSVFPWIEALEASSPDILSEFKQVASEHALFQPYVQHPQTAPIDQWAALNHNHDWSAFHIVLNGQPVSDNAKHTPLTMAALSAVDAPDIPNRCPGVMFSLLKPGTRIPPHTGDTNARLICHLALIVPESCGFRVGNETRIWQEGCAWVFDDTIEHEAWNLSSQPRVILMFDIWNPYLQRHEREMIAALMQSRDMFMGQKTSFTGL